MVCHSVIIVIQFGVIFWLKLGHKIVLSAFEHYTRGLQYHSIRF